MALCGAAEPLVPRAARLGGAACPLLSSAGPALEVSAVGFRSADAAGCRMLLVAFPLATLLQTETSAMPWDAALFIDITLQ